MAADPKIGTSRAKKTSRKHKRVTPIRRHKGDSKATGEAIIKKRKAEAARKAKAKKKGK